MDSGVLFHRYPQFPTGGIVIDKVLPAKWKIFLLTNNVAQPKSHGQRELHKLHDLGVSTAATTRYSGYREWFPVTEVWPPALVTERKSR